MTHFRKIEKNMIGWLHRKLCYANKNHVKLNFTGARCASKRSFPIREDKLFIFAVNTHNTIKKRIMLFRVATLVLAIALPIQAFAPVTRFTPTARHNVELFNSPGTVDSEKQLKQEIAERNSQVEDEGQYAVADGEGFAALVEDAEAQIESSSTKKDQSIQARIERLTKPRAYPLFLAEKAAEIVETTMSDVAKSLGSEIPSSLANGSGKKEKIVILGSGWGSVSFLKDIDTNRFDVTVISPRNYFLFTPMLAGASVGTVEYRSITESIREVNRKSSFLEATATDIDVENKIVTCESVVCDSNSCDVEEVSVEYDRLIVTIGAQSNTFGIPGVREHCYFLKHIEDARMIRSSIVNSFERANLPHLTEKEKIGNLTFAVIGAGPTGVEFAAELRDFIEQDAPRYYPELIKYVRIKVIEASSTVLAPFDKALQEEAIAQMKREIAIEDEEVRKSLPPSFELVELYLDSSVKEITDQTISLNDGTDLDYGVAVWAAGNGPLPLTLDLVKKLGSEQDDQQDIARGRVAIDPWMRAIGSQGSILAFGDCSCNPQRALPATAQVASQQGEYLAKLFNKKYEFSPKLSDEGIFLPPTMNSEDAPAPTLSDAIANFATQNSEKYAKPFQFLDLGILAYTGGGSALAQVTAMPDASPLKGTGSIGNAVWKSVYLSKQVSWRNRLMVANDWANNRVFGRDISRI